MLKEFHYFRTVSPNSRRRRSTGYLRAKPRLRIKFSKLVEVYLFAAVAVVKASQVRKYVIWNPRQGKQANNRG